MHSNLFSKIYNNDHHVPQKIYTYLTNCFNFTTYCILYTEANALSRHNESMNHVKFCVVLRVSSKPSKKYLNEWKDLRRHYFFAYEHILYHH